jgi:redox-sensitive bicupin YhaK (pirin superfamily)
MTTPTPQALRVEPGSIGTGFKAAGLRGPLDPFISVDHFLMSEPTFPPHPHAGFNVLTYMLPRSAGSFVNRASFDQPAVIDAGDLHWTVAGSGMVHEEVPQRIGVVCDGLQIFINLRAEQKFIQPASLHQLARDTAEVEFEGGRVKAVLGEVTIQGATARSPLRPPTPVTMLDIEMEPESFLSLPVAAGHNAFALVISGSVLFGDKGPVFGADSGATFGTSSTARVIDVHAAAASQVIFFAGDPIAEPLVAQGPFVMNTAAQLHDAMVAFRSGRMGSLTPYYG